MASIKRTLTDDEDTLVIHIEVEGEKPIDVMFEQFDLKIYIYTLKDSLTEYELECVKEHLNSLLYFNYNNYEGIDVQGLVEILK